MSLQLYFPKEGDDIYPFFNIPIPAGQAQSIDQIVEYLNLDEFVRATNYSTYYVHVIGESMEDAGIFDGDLLVVERREYAENGDIVIAELNGEFTIKELEKKQSLYLVPKNSAYSKTKVIYKDDFNIWGVVKYILHKPRKDKRNI